MLGLIEQALDEAEREDARTEETAAGQPDEANARYEPDADCPDAGADGEEAEADSAENAPSEAGEDGEETEEADSAESAENAFSEAGEYADSGDGVRSADWNGAP